MVTPGPKRDRQLLARIRVGEPTAVLYIAGRPALFFPVVEPVVDDFRETTR